MEKIPTPDETRKLMKPIFGEVDIVIVTYNRLRYLEACIESIVKNTLYPYGQIIVVDNNSSDGTPEWLKEQVEKGILTYVAPGENIGRTRALELGAARSGCEIIASSDDDAWYNPGWLAISMAILDAFPEVDVASVDGRRTVQYVKTERRNGVSVDFRTSLRTFHLVYRKKPLARAGGMILPRGKLLGSGFPFGQLHKQGGHAAKLTIDEHGTAGLEAILNRFRDTDSPSMIPGDLGNGVLPKGKFVEHMDTRGRPKSHLEFYENSGYREFARRAKRGGVKEFTPKKAARKG